MLSTQSMASDMAVFTQSLMLKIAKLLKSDTEGYLDWHIINN